MSAPVSPSRGRAPLGAGYPSNVPGRQTPVLALSIEDACEALGVSWRTWNDYIAGEVRIVRCGRRKLVAVAELQAWLDRRAEAVLSE